MSGKVAESDQSDVQQPGTCLAIDGRGVGDPTDCGGAHAVETVGVVDLAKKWDGGFPAVADQDAYLQPACAKVAADYAGGDKVIADKKLTVYWDNITEDSWKAGSRKVNCNLAALLPDRSGFAPVTGSVKGAVSVGSQPAPSAPDSSTPGAPASTTDRPTSASAPSSAPASTSKAPSESDDEQETATQPPSPAPVVPLPPVNLPVPSGY
jgi:hypothetical protein